MRRPGRRGGGAGRAACDALAGGGDDGLVGEAELLVEHGVGGAGAVVVQADDPAGVADELAPAHRHAGLDADPGADRGRQHLVAVGLVLLGEPLDAGHDTTRVGTPSASSRSRAATAICTSEPVPMRITSGVPYEASAST